MIKELVQFVESLDSDFKNKGIEPKEGLHILLKINAKESFDWSFQSYKSGKTPNNDFLKTCSKFAQMSWNVNTNKCFDLPAKGVHSCSPFCVAFKKESLEGGEKYAKDKVKIYDRFEKNYFPKAHKVVEDNPTALSSSQQFARFFYNRQLWENPLKEMKEFIDLKSKEYIVFYLDVSDELYDFANKKYLAENLFNTNDFNKETEVDNEKIMNGTSDFFTGYNSKKPFLMHQTATFDVLRRITEGEARGLFEFQNIIRRGILPRPLPIFIYPDEVAYAVKLLKDETTKLSYRDIVKDFQTNYRKKEASNYYLLYYQADEIKDFDFVSKFEFELKDTEGGYWNVQNLFTKKSIGTLNDVFDFETKVLPIIFNNNLVVQMPNKSPWLRYFDDIESAKCKSDLTYIVIMKYRKAFFDFIYKSRRELITVNAFDEIMKTLTLDAIRRDEMKWDAVKKMDVHTEDWNIRQKLNVWFSLREKFNSKIKIQRTMASKLKEMQAFVDDLLDEKVDLTTQEQYAFLAGQVIYYILSKSKSKDKSHARLEPFLQQTQFEQFRKAIQRIFNQYKHENFSSRFHTAFAYIESRAEERFEKPNLANEMPTMLAGFFSNNTLFSQWEKKKDKELKAELDNQEEVNSNS